MPRLIPVSLLVALVVACDSTARVAAPPRPGGTPADSATTTAATVGRVVLNVDTSIAIVGRRLHIQIDAQDAYGKAIDAGSAEFTSSNDAVIQLANMRPATVIPASGAPVTVVLLDVDLVAPGTTTLRARLGNVADSVTLTVASLPPLSNALTVDNFSVIEYRVTCAWNCPYLAYAPLLRLREPTGVTSASVVAVQFSVPTMTTGLCRGSLPFPPGQSSEVNYINPYLWSNDLIFVSLSGTPLPDDPATARVIVRNARGALGLIEVSAPITRAVAQPNLPTTTSDLEPWTC